jgi:hypothetical protein
VGNGRSLHGVRRGPGERLHSTLRPATGHSSGV